MTPDDGMASSPLRVLVADDHPALRIGMKAVIKSMKAEAVLAGVASDGNQAIEKYRALRPDVMTLDLRMPGLDGLVVLERILELDASAKILVMTMYDSEEDVFRSLDAGATGYILKSASRSEIVQAIQSVSRGERHVPEHIALKLASRASTAALTPREIEVLELLRLGITNKEIAESLRVAAGTVKTHVRVILTKLGAMSRTEAVNIAIQRGLLR
jgi:two-component system NarL family response regulator